jgi:hypothetical protein
MLYEHKIAEENAEYGDKDKPTCPRCGGPGRTNAFGGHEPCHACPDLEQNSVRIVERADGAVEFRVPTSWDITQATD